MSLSGLMLTDLKVANHAKFKSIYSAYYESTHDNVVKFYKESKAKKNFQVTNLAEMLKKMSAVANSEKLDGVYYFCVDSQGKITDSPVSLDSRGIIHNTFSFKKVVFSFIPSISEIQLQGEDSHTDAEVWADVSGKSPGHDPSQPGFARDNRDPRDTSFFNPNSMSPSLIDEASTPDPSSALDMKIDLENAIKKELRGQGLSSEDITKEIRNIYTVGKSKYHRVNALINHMVQTRVASLYLLKNNK